MLMRPAPPSIPQRRARGALRALALLVAALSFFQQTSTSLHFALVRHAICPEHGDVVHVGESHVSEFPAEAARDSDGPIADRHDETEHGHEHCVALSTQRSGADPRAHSLRLEALRWSTPSEVRDATVAEHPAVALLLLAPKNSPPG